MKKVVGISLLIILLILVVTEFGLRRFAGLGTPPLMVADEQIGYYYAPNQSVVRFGNRILINEYAQRSEPVQLSKAEEWNRILLLGDSIAFGTVQADHEEIVSEVMEDLLTIQLDTPFEVLNASAGSWGIQNELAYLERFSLLEADYFVLLLNTGDLCQSQSTSAQVGTPDYPDQNPPLALVELLIRYLPRYLPNLSTTQTINEQTCEFDTNMSALNQIIEYSGSTPFFLVLSPLRCETEKENHVCFAQEQRRQFNEVLLQYRDRENFHFIDVLERWDRLHNLGYNLDDIWRDRYHYLPLGNRLLATVIAEHIRRFDHTFDDL